MEIRRGGLREGKTLWAWRFVYLKSCVGLSSKTNAAIVRFTCVWVRNVSSVRFLGETGCIFSEEKQEEVSACCLLLIGIGTAKDGEAAMH